MMHYLSKWVLSLSGWKVNGGLPIDIDKLVILVAPHTSGWDIIIALLVKFYLKVKVYYAAKQSLFKFPLKHLLLATGGIPIYRGEGNSSVEQIVSFMNSKNRIHFALAPEGSRKKVAKLKSGFYRIATATESPLILVKLDFTLKELSFSAPYYIIDQNKEEVMEYVSNYFRGVLGKNKENSFT